MTKVLITTSSFGKDDKLPLNSLRQAGCEVVLNPYGRKLTEDEILNLILEVRPDAIIAGLEPLTERVLNQAETLKTICRCGTGMDNVDRACACDLGIIVDNTPDGPTEAVAELTVGLIFDLLRKISYLDRELRNGNWVKENGSLLFGKKVGLIGLGRIGRRVAEMLVVLGAKVSGADIQPDLDWIKRYQVSLASFEEILRDSDILSIHVSTEKENGYLIGTAEIESMKKGAYLLNLSRGHVVDEEALYTALAQGHMSGVALDVFAQEPYSGPLTALDNVILTPHVGSYAKETRVKMEMESVNNVLSALKKVKTND